jgi:L-ascorbate metabolism protein UlaG (beta-lactamase superfamily)
VTTIEWFGCTTFRVRTGGRTLWFDTFVDRAPGAEPVGLAAEDVDNADFIFVSHAHFDHLLGADVVSGNTGAPIVGNYEVARVMRDNGVEETRVWPASGGETVDCGGGIRVRVLPSLHSCLWASGELDAGAPCLGDLGLVYQQRREKVAQIWSLLRSVVPDDYAATIDQRTSHHDGGQLSYLVETPDGTIFVSASSGQWSGILRDLRPDVAVLAATGRPNVDGEPFQGSMADFLVGQVETLRPRQLLLCHHDAWMPGLPPLDVGPIEHRLRDRAPAAELVTLGYGDPLTI